MNLPQFVLNNGKGHARASAHGLRAIMETMLHGSQFYMLFKEAFHIYGSFFETKKDEEAFRDILLHPETGLNVVIVTHPVTLERFVVLNNPSCDVSMFLNHFTQEFLSCDENADQLRLDQETVSALLKNMDTEYDRSILRGLRAIIAILDTRSETVNLGIDPTLARRKIKEVIEVAEECRMSIVAGEDIVNLRLKDRLKRIDAETEEKKTVLEKKRETWPLKRLSDLEESLRHLEDRKEEVNRLVRKEDKSSANKVTYAAKRVADSLLEQNRVKRRRLGAGESNGNGRRRGTIPSTIHRGDVLPLTEDGMTQSCT